MRAPARQAGRAPAVLLAAVAFACAPPSPVPAPAAPTAHCEAGDTALMHDVIYFGRNRPDGGVVSDAEWRAYLDSVVTPRFPGGLTVVDAQGQWRGADGTVERERAAVLTLLHSGDSAARRAVGELAAEYKRRFGQEAVLRERLAACARF